jgi:flavorubredoxin
MVMLNDFADRAPRVLSDGEVLAIGQHRLRFLSTPQVPHGWDAGLYFDETTRTLLCSDLFFQPGDPEPLTESDLVGRAKEAIQGGLTGPMAKDMPYTPYTDSTLRRLAALAPTTLATMHGSSFRGNGQKAILDLAVVLKELLSKSEGGS